MCILSGCDYLPSIPGMGLATANKMLKKFGQDPHKARLPATTHNHTLPSGTVGVIHLSLPPLSFLFLWTQVIAHMKMQKGKAVPELYSEGFKQAEETFLFQLVFDPRTQKQTRLNPVPDDVECADFEFAGSYPLHHSPVEACVMPYRPVTYAWCCVLIPYPLAERCPLGRQLDLHGATSTHSPLRSWPITVPARCVCMCVVCVCVCAGHQWCTTCAWKVVRWLRALLGPPCRPTPPCTLTPLRCGTRVRQGL